MPKSGHRSRGEGSITQRKDGLWQASIQIDGRRRTAYGKTRRAAVIKLDELKQQAMQAGQLPDPGRRTLADLLEAWLAVKAVTVKARTLFDYQNTADHYVLPTLGKLRLSRVTPDRIQRLYITWQSQGKHRTALKIHQVLAPAFTLAVRWGWLGANPCHRVDRPRYRAPRKAVWTKQELNRFLDGTRTHWLYPVWIVALSTGARIGELLALTWNDVDLTARTVRINKTTARIKGQMVTTSPKTEAGERTISLPPDAVEVLRRLAEQSLATGGGQQVFRGNRGAVLVACTVEAVMRRECERLGLPRMTPHSLRHLHASLLISEGLPITAVSKRLGHANAAITLTIYAHALDNGDAQATEAIERALAR